jgi:hypothetical protein|tara:strand:- start:517 stop:927 length:411 start_codon:yes stop_codon:yes gene_type:complete
MSTVKAANLQNTGSGAPAFKNSSGTEIGQLCKAWVNFNGTGTVAIRDNFNVSSITDNGTGDYTVTFANAMANVNYAVAGACRFGSNNNADIMRVMSVNSAGTLANAMQASSVRVNTCFQNGGEEDVQMVSVVIFGG